MRSLAKDWHKIKYPNLAEASAATRRLGLSNWAEYSTGYREDPRLPAKPSKFYEREWENGYAYFGTAAREKKYKTIEKASRVAIALGIKTDREYARRYKEDSRLPALPADYYKKYWKNWYAFLGKSQRVEKYVTLGEALEATRKLSIKTRVEYYRRYKEDLRLPHYPEAKYKDDWDGWYSYLGTTKAPEKYKTLADASIAARRLGFKNEREYIAGFHQDPRLRAYPSKLYDEWESMAVFLGQTTRLIYPTLAQAQSAVRNLGFTSAIEYYEGYKQDAGLPAKPGTYYPNWAGWKKFLLPDEYLSLNDVKRAVKIIDIKNSKQYREVYKRFPPLPAHPERVFSADWIDWYDLCDIPRHYSYEEASCIVQAAGIKTQADYLQYAVSTADPRLPKSPDDVYKFEWKNWYKFLGKVEPFGVEFIDDSHKEWARSITLFMKKARGGPSKEANLCRFVRLYIERYKLGVSPVDFLVSKSIDVRQFKDIVGQQVSEAAGRSLWWAVKEFVDYIIKTKLTIEDEETGELITVLEVRNPFSSMMVETEREGGLAETCKPALAYQYVDAARKWIIPPSAKNFSDLTHLQVFPSDWIEIDPLVTVLDELDSDCIYKIDRGKLKFWCPIKWLHTYALLSVPARGRQIAYSDSGEGDLIIPEIDGETLVWEKNTSPLSGRTDHQGFIKHYPSDEFGMHFTSNKTDFHGRGYSVPWMPRDLIYWIIRLRNWQRKYNAVEQPMPWLDCIHTNLNETQRKAKGSNFFLFRGFGEQEPGHFSNNSARRLAAALYNSQPKGLELASLKGSPNLLSHYKSKYTPHSMRVSLITAYIVEFGLPVEIIMKVAGHASILMSIYYIRLDGETLRSRFNEGEKLALKNKAFAAQRMIEQGRVDEIKRELISNSSGTLIAISGGTPVGSYLFRDYGFCPFAGARCCDGGPVSTNTHVRLPVPNGYLGCQNCLRCRHFVTGPAFIGGLLSISNEISLQANYQFKQYSRLQDRVDEVLLEIDTVEEAEYNSLKSGQDFDGEIRSLMEIKLRKLRSESESAAMKLDMLMCDIQAAVKLIKQCQALINQQVLDESEASKTQLIVQLGHELQLVVEEVSYFKQLSEVCENAEIYESASAQVALVSRSQLIDRMSMLNDFSGRMFTLSLDQQLVIGNQVTKLLLSRLKTWERLDSFVEGDICIQDLSADERITLREFDDLFLSSRKFVEEDNYGPKRDS